MKVEFRSQTAWAGRFSVALVLEGSEQPLGISGPAGRRLVATAREEGFTGKPKQTVLLRLERSDRRILLVGLGRRRGFGPDQLRTAAAVAVGAIEKVGAPEFGLLVPDSRTLPCRLPIFLAAVVEGISLAAYRYDEHRTVRPDQRPPGSAILLLPRGRKAAPVLKRVAAEAGALADAVCYVRDLVNEPPSQKAPEMMAELAAWLAKRDRIQVEVFRKPDLARMGMNGILRVGAGSSEPPCLVQLTYTPSGRSRKSVCLVGKGITFDSGGLSLKPSDSMGSMKSDMAGAATVLGLFRFLGEVDLPLTVRGLVPLAENLPGGSAQKPGDVIRQYGGKTVEVLNTDAEGRLILADALAYGSKFRPDLMVDLATLTGACVIALGDECSGLLGTDRRTIEKLRRIGADQGEHFWELPLFEPYREHLKSKVADIKNIGKPRVAGTIVAGLFLREFVDRRVPWVHIDIAGTAFTSDSRNYVRSGATGVPLRSLVTLLRTL